MLKYGRKLFQVRSLPGLTEERRAELLAVGEELEEPPAELTPELANWDQWLNICLGIGASEVILRESGIVERFCLEVVLWVQHHSPIAEGPGAKATCAVMADIAFRPQLFRNVDIWKLARITTVNEVSRRESESPEDRVVFVVGAGSAADENLNGAGWWPTEGTLFLLELKGSIGEGPNDSNHSNHSNHSNSFKIGIFPRKFKNFRKFQHFLNYRRNSDKIYQNLSKNQ